MPAPTITTLPPAPSRGDAPDLFVSRADAMLAALAEFVADANAMGLFMDGVALASAENLAAQIALVASGGFSATSTTSNAIEVGSKTFAIQANRSFVAGSPVTVAVSASPSVNFMTGVVTAYNPTTGAITVDVSSIQGTGTFAAWTITLSGPRGAVGPPVSRAFTSSASTTLALQAGGRYRLTARITAGTLPVSPGLVGDPIEIETAIDASNNHHTFTPNGTETVTVNGVAGSPWLFDALPGTIIKLIPVAGGWEQGK